MKRKHDTSTTIVLASGPTPTHEERNRLLSLDPDFFTQYAHDASHNDSDVTPYTFASAIFLKRESVVTNFCQAGFADRILITSEVKRNALAFAAKYGNGPICEQLLMTCQDLRLFFTQKQKDPFVYAYASYFEEPTQAEINRLQETLARCWQKTFCAVGKLHFLSDLQNIIEGYYKPELTLDIQS